MKKQNLNFYQSNPKFKMHQTDLFSPQVKKEEAMDRVDKNANQDFRRVAFKALVNHARHKQFITANDVWDGIELLGIETHDNRALGPIFLKAAREGWIEKTNQTMPSSRSSRHAGDVRIWRSLLFGPAIAA